MLKCRCVFNLGCFFVHFPKPCGLHFLKLQTHTWCIWWCFKLGVPQSLYKKAKTQNLGHPYLRRFLYGKCGTWVLHQLVLPFFHTWDLDSNISDASWWQNLFWNQTWFGPIVNLNMPCLLRLKWHGASCCFAHLHFSIPRLGQWNKKTNPTTMIKYPADSSNSFCWKNVYKKCFHDKMEQTGTHTLKHEFKHFFKIKMI